MENQVAWERDTGGKGCCFDLSAVKLSIWRCNAQRAATGLLLRAYAGVFSSPMENDLRFSVFSIPGKGYSVLRRKCPPVRWSAARCKI